MTVEVKERGTSQWVGLKATADVVSSPDKTYRAVSDWTEKKLVEKVKELLS